MARKSKYTPEVIEKIIGLFEPGGTL